MEFPGQPVFHRGIVSLPMCDAVLQTGCSNSLHSSYVWKINLGLFSSLLRGLRCVVVNSNSSYVYSGRVGDAGVIGQRHLCLLHCVGARNKKVELHNQKRHDDCKIYFIFITCSVVGQPFSRFWCYFLTRSRSRVYEQTPKNCQPIYRLFKYVVVPMQGPKAEKREVLVYGNAYPDFITSSEQCIVPKIPKVISVSFGYQLSGFCGEVGHSEFASAGILPFLGQVPI